MMGALTACDSIDCGTKRDNFQRATRKSDQLAFMSFGDEETQDPYAVGLNRDRNHRGYAIQAPLHGDDSAVQSHLTFSRTKDYRWFSGLQFSLAF